VLDLQNSVAEKLPEDGTLVPKYVQAWNIRWIYETLLLKNFLRMALWCRNMFRP